jgi:photosystem II stability/assembly factor-like uncharacterized protein
MKNLFSKKVLIILLSFIFIFLVNSNLKAQLGWYFENSGTNQTLTCIRFLNGNTAWAVGWFSNILKTSNGGSNWVQVNSGVSTSFQNTFFVNVNTGWVVGQNGTIIKTTNAGDNWFTQSSGVTSLLMYVHFYNLQTGWICGAGGVVLKTTNSGINWISKNVGATTNLNCIYFINNTTGFVDGDNGTIRKSTNGGDNWYNITTPLTYNLDKFFFINENSGWVTGINGTILKTTNGGNNWLFTYTGVYCWITAIHFFDIYTGYASGGDYDNQTSGVILKTVNGGINWVETTHPVVPWMSFISFISPDTGWCVGQNGTIIKTVDGGMSIPVAPILNTPSNNATVNTMIPNLTWFVSGGATNYTVQISPLSNFSIITDSNTTINLNYTVPNGKLTNGLNYCWRVKASNYLGTSPWSNVWNFTVQFVPSAPNLIYPSNASNILITNPVFDWDSIPGVTNYHIQISKVSNFSVLTDSMTVPYSYYAIALGKLEVNNTYFWRVKARASSVEGPWSALWYFSVVPTSLNLISSTIPEKYNLYQNYPNPFNPTTKIKFDVPKNSFNSAIIYDVLGKQIEKVFEGNLNPGSYEFNWNASKYTSGIYFVRIQGDKFVATKRMMLIK